MILLLTFVTSATAFTTFRPTCSLPDTVTSYVSSANTRGTLDILWTSLATIFACVYTSLHLNVPEQRRDRDPGWRGDIYWTWKNTRSSLTWATVSVLAPELVLAKAIWDLQEALAAMKILRTKDPNSAWTTQHLVFAGMGGFVAIEKDYVHHLSLDELVRSIQQGIVSKQPPITAAGIMDKSKVDITGRFIAIFQICYFVVSTIVRSTKGLAVSQLELGTCAFVPFAVALYAVSYLKPKGVSTTITVLQGRLPDSIAASYGDSLIKYVVYGSMSNHKRTPGSRIGNDWVIESKTSDPLYWAIPLTIIFGAIHLIAWSFDFPTYIDLIFWRVASLVVTTIYTALLLMSLLVIFLLGLLSEHLDTDSILDSIFPREGWLPFISGCYIIARLVLVVEMFRTLAFLPTSSYVGTWTASVPHIG